MEVLTIISIIVGILVGLIALMEKTFHIFTKNRHAQNEFEHGFSDWKNSEFSYIPKHDDVRRFIGYVVRNELDDRREAFALLCAIQHGDRSLHELIERNKKNSIAIPFVFDFVKGRGIRVGWRAEYALSQFRRDEVARYIDKLPEEFKKSDSMAQSIQRILEDRVEDFIKEQVGGNDQKLRSYANQVLHQIQTRIAPKPSL